MTTPGPFPASSQEPSSQGARPAGNSALSKEFLEIYLKDRP
jgi:hypothetical protein